MRAVDEIRAWGRQFKAYFAPERSASVLARKQISLMAALLTVAAIAGAVVLKPSQHSEPDASWGRLKQQIRGRAKVDLFDDFSTGLDAWRNGGDAASTWSYDKGGFIMPGALSFFEPSMALTDYDVDALLQIEKRGVGIAIRAAGLKNYEAVRLLVEGSGPMPNLALEHYGVTGGKASRPVLVRCPEQFQADTLYHVHLQAHGDEFALYLQGQLVDYWSDHRARSGGVGLFCGRGELARVAWIRVSHNADSLGSMCSLLASLF
jgi:hypothetical protein